MTGKMIKLRRKELGMNAEALAAKCGLSPATIYRYESGDIENMGIDKLIPIADALHTTPAYLMGWEDAPKSSAAAPADELSAAPADELSAAEQELVRRYRKATDADRAVVDLVLEKYAAPSSSGVQVG